MASTVPPKESAAQKPTFLYDVFLSYSRKDRDFAVKLEKALESYSPPKRLNISKRGLNVFRDQADIEAAEDYYRTIERHLKGSEKLVVVCSPDARRSKFIEDEIRRFIESHSVRDVIPILYRGRANNEAVDEDEMAFPEALCQDRLPLAASYLGFDVRRDKLDKGEFRDSWYSILAAIFGVDRRRLEQIDERAKARRRAVMLALTGAIIAVLSVALVFAMISRREAVTQRQEAVRQRDQARRLLYASNISLAQRAYEGANIDLGRELLRPYLPGQADGLEEQRGFEWYYLWRLYNSDLATFDDTSAIAFAGDSATFATATAKEVKLWDAASLQQKFSIEVSNPRPSAEAPPDAQSGTGGADSRSTSREGSGEGSIDWRTSYSSDVNHLSFSPDGKTLIFGDKGRMVLYDLGAKTAREIPKQIGIGIPRFSPDGKLLAIAYLCGSVTEVYDTASLVRIAQLGDGPPGSSCSTFVTFSPNGKLLAYSTGFNVRLWDTVARRDVGEPEMDESLPDSVGEVFAVAFSPDSRLLALGDNSKAVVLWEIATKKVRARLKGHEAFVTATAFSPDGKILFSGSDDHTVKLWDLSSYRKDATAGVGIEEIATIRGHAAGITSIGISPKGKIAAVASADDKVMLWAVEAAGREFLSFGNRPVFSPASNITAANGGRGTIKLYNITGNELPPLNTQADELSFSPDGQTLITLVEKPYTFLSDRSIYNGFTIKLWDLTTRRELAALEGGRPVFSRDGRVLACLSPDQKSVRLWDVTAQKELASFGFVDPVGKLFLSPDGKILVTVDQNHPRVRSWDTAAQKMLAEFESKPEQVMSSTADTFVDVRLDFLPDGKTVVIASNEIIKLWDITSRQLPATLGEHKGSVSVLRVSPEGRILAVGDQKKTVMIWDLGSRKELASFRGHNEAVTALAFSPDGLTLASGSAEGTIKLYSLNSLRELITLRHKASATAEVHAQQGSEDEVQELVFSTNSRVLFSLSGNGVGRVWTGATDEQIAARRK